MSGSLGRRLILRLAESPAVNRFVRRFGPGLGAYRFVAGDTLDDALAAVGRLADKGITATLDRLGEGKVDRAYADAATADYVRIIGAIASRNLPCHVSLKLTQLGLDLDPAFCEEKLRQIVEAAATAGTFVRVDMEDSARTEATLSLFERVRKDFPNVGIVIQAYLRRSQDDLRRMGALDASVRVVKGAYMEGPDVAFPDKADVDRNYRALVAMHLGDGHDTAVATHDEALIAFTESFVREHSIPKDGFEFQMLYGIRPQRQEELARQGYRMRVYVPFGPDWYPYFMRRLAERPANLGFFLKSLFRA